MYPLTISKKTVVIGCTITVAIVATSIVAVYGIVSMII